MTNLDSVLLKSRDVTLLTKVHIDKAMVFPVIMYGCESWTMKKAEHRRIGAFRLWCWRRLLSIPCTAMRSNQSILKEINPEHSLGLMLKLQYFGHLMLGKSKGKRRSGWQRMRRSDSIPGSVDVNLSELWAISEGQEPCCAAAHGVAKSGSWLSSWTAAVIQVVVWVVDHVFISSVLFLLKLSQFREIINNQIYRNWEGVGSWGETVGS